MIPNHVCASFSELDLQIAKAVPPGGNWRDIPTSVPSDRLAQIRESAAKGQGSRSTYYGRLHPERPAYTINTYYTRPGNGCFLHYDAVGGQHRTLSHREAARLQSFPDHFVFHGTSQRAICQQIGNAVPPLLALQIAQTLGEPGVMIDVFSGAGGLSLGFEWAGWQSLAAADNDRHAVATYNSNLAPVAFVGDMTKEEVHDRLVDTAKNRAGRRLALVGGPPCQGFSTGGKSRSVDDERNGLHDRYAALLARLRPDVFIFENVLGLLSLDGGRFVTRVLDGLKGAGYDVTLWRLNAARFGVPQRRERVIIVGVPHGLAAPVQPSSWTTPAEGDELFSLPLVCSVREALADLPKLTPGQDGSNLPYRSKAVSTFQKVMRGDLAPVAYVAGELGINDQARQRSPLRCIPEGAEASITG